MRRVLGDGDGVYVDGKQRNACECEQVDMNA